MKKRASQGMEPLQVWTLRDAGLGFLIQQDMHLCEGDPNSHQKMERIIVFPGTAAWTPPLFLPLLYKYSDNHPS
jgi:hypothetical protein